MDTFGSIVGLGASVLMGVNATPDQLRPMSAEQMAEYMRRQGDPTNVPWELRMQGDAFRAMNANRPRKPTMTLAEYDARRAAFRP